MRGGTNEMMWPGLESPGVGEQWGAVGAELLAPCVGPWPRAEQVLATSPLQKENVKEIRE